MQKLRFCVFGGLLSSCSASPSLLHSPCCCIRMPCQKHWGLSPGEGKQGRQKRKTSAANLRKKHYYMPCKKRFFRLSSSYLYFFHILTIMCCQNKIFPRLRPFSVEHTGGVSSCSTGKRRLHGKAERGTGRKAAMICAKKPPETNECAIFPGVRFRRFFSSCTTSITPREGHRKPPGPAVVRNIAKSGKRAFQGLFRPENRKHRTSLR